MTGARLVALAAAVAATAAGCAGRTRLVEGRVLDHATERPVGGTVVTLSVRGWGISDGQLVWDKERVTQAVADAEGRFRTRVRGSSVNVAADAAGYVRYGGWLEDDRPAIRLVARRATSPSIVYGMVEVGLRDGAPYGWNLAGARTTSRRDSADVWPTVGGSAEDPEVVLNAPAGILALREEAIGPVDDPLLYVEEAPERGYLAAVRVRPGERGVLVVRSRDGRVAKLDANPMIVGATRERAAGHVGFSFRYAFNRAAGRDLVWQQP